MIGETMLSALGHRSYRINCGHTLAVNPIFNNNCISQRIRRIITVRMAPVLVAKALQYPQTNPLKSQNKISSVRSAEMILSDRLVWFT